MHDDIPLIGAGEPTPRSERSDAAANRARILAAARALFAARGVAAVTMAEIAQAASVGKGTLYRRYADKGALCLGLIDDELRAFQNDTLSELRRLTREGSTLLDQLAWFLDALIFFQEAHLPLLFEAQREGLLSGDKFIPVTFQNATTRALLQEAVAVGEVASDLDIEYLAAALLAPLSAPFYRYQRQTRGISPERMSAGLRQLVMGLRVG